MKASDTFHMAPYNHNCAQAVAFRWQRLYAESSGEPSVVERYAAYGGGRAPGGCCGALYAAMQAVPDHAEEIRRDFAAVCGATTCRELKGANRIPCTRCVDASDTLVATYLTTPDSL